MSLNYSNLISINVENDQEEFGFFEYNLVILLPDGVDSKSFIELYNSTVDSLYSQIKTLNQEIEMIRPSLYIGLNSSNKLPKDHPDNISNATEKASIQKVLNDKITLRNQLFPNPESVVKSLGGQLLSDLVDNKFNMCDDKIIVS